MHSYIQRDKWAYLTYLHAFLRFIKTRHGKIASRWTTVIIIWRCAHFSPHQTAKNVITQSKIHFHRFILYDASIRQEIIWLYSWCRLVRQCNNTDENEHRELLFTKSRKSTKWTKWYVDSVHLYTQGRNIDVFVNVSWFFVMKAKLQSC